MMCSNQSEADDNFKGLVSWCARLQFEGYEPFLFGHFYTGEMPSQQAIDESMWKAVDLLYPLRPKLIEQLLGKIIFIPTTSKLPVRSLA
jgi:hypothetical protein